MEKNMINHFTLLKTLWREILKITIYILIGVKIINCYFVNYVERSQDYKFYDITSSSFFETKNVRFFEEIEFGKEENIRNVDHEEESINDIGQVLVPITIQEITPVIEDNVQTIVPKQDYSKLLPQTLI
ncbi:hypothetical protein CR513_10105, partial [Mucuna pruriens]